MGHYDEYYDKDYEDARKRKKKALEQALAEFYEFRQYRPGRDRKWYLSDIKLGETLYDQLITNIKAELYDLRGVTCA